ncbi:MAG: thioesterase domain-containing protein [Cyanobacteria bacterium P01_H01_bin.15]
MKNIYAPTQTTLAKSFYPIPQSILPGVQPLGQPLPNTQVLVINHAGKLCGVGEPGEIVIRTPFRSLGYLNNPEETLRQYLQNYFRTDSRDLIYLTGDRGVYGTDGDLRILGRLDDQVKIRGVRVEPREIDGVLSKYEALINQVTVAKEDERGESQLVTYFVSAAGVSITPSQLRRYLKGLLPAPMIPNQFIPLVEIPLTPNGKVDRPALPEPQWQLESVGGEPRDELERSLIQIWQQLLNVPSIGIHDDFFALGGHSLIAVRLFAHLKTEFSKELPLATLFEAPTIADLATIIRNNTHPKKTNLIPIQPEGDRIPLFFFPPAGGHLLVYERLARNLGSEQPVYGLEFYTSDVEGSPKSLEKQVELFIAAMRQGQPRGPYFLVGLSYGGLVAWTLANKLQEQGDELGGVILLDTSAPGDVRALNGLNQFLSVLRWVVFDRVRHCWRLSRDRTTSLLKLAPVRKAANTITTADSRQRDQEVAHRLQTRVQQVVSTLQQQSRSSLSERLKYWGARLLTRSSAPYYAKRLYSKGQGYFENLDGIIDPLMLADLEKNRQLFRQFSPQPLNTNILIFRAQERMPGIQESSALGWQQYMTKPEKMTIIPIKGTHHTIVTSADLARKLLQYIDSLELRSLSSIG